MLYPKSKESFSTDEFKDPGKEYRGAPFWAWNCHLGKDTITKQIDIFKSMGFGGFHAHVRTGMDTPYLKEEFQDYIRLCAKLAKEKDMLLWLYDEDRWPSGAAGGYVTKDPRYRERFLCLSPLPKPGYAPDRSSFDRITNAGQSSPGYLIAKYHVVLQDGLLKEYRRLCLDTIEDEDTWYVYLSLSDKSAWYNNQTYVNTLDKNAIDCFISHTHETYAKLLQDEFSKTVPAIFTDEPQFKTKQTFNYSEEKKEIILPFTDDFPETFFSTYGYDILEKLPEIFWNKRDYSQVRYHYHDHICTRFVEAFPKNIGSWCASHNLALTGHVNAEPTLTTQTYSVGAAMRCYPYFQLPGIDMLCDGYEFTTAKQAASIVHQYGREGMLSELYGVTNWDFDFKGHKLHGDWQAALGVTIRVPHLSWMSMEGEAKRDYPASIFYQSPWYKEYPLIENHFARLNTAMTRGNCRIRIGIIHPVESFWLLWGPQQQSYYLGNQLEENFSHLTEWMLFGLMDFDFIDESLLPSQVTQEVPLSVGSMRYDVIILPSLLTIRHTTVDILNQFIESGGKVIALGTAPSLVDAKPDNEGHRLWEKAVHIPFEHYALMQSVEPYRIVDILGETGVRTSNLLYQLRLEGDTEWLFISHVYHKNNNYEIPEAIRIRVQGYYSPELFDTISGEHKAIECRYENGWTVIDTSFYAEDSLLYRLTVVNADPLLTVYDEPAFRKLPAPGDATQTWTDLPEPVSYKLEEPNPLLLDMAEYSLNDEDYLPREELLRLDNKIRTRLQYPTRMEHVAQPWVIEEKNTGADTLRLRFRFNSEIFYHGALLGLEIQANQKVIFNGNVIPLHTVGYFTDACIKTIPLTDILPGNNELILEMEYTEKTNVEWCYILGDFGVQVYGDTAIITKLPAGIVYGDLTRQGFPFYGANITYTIELSSDGIHDTELFIPRFNGPIIRIHVDDTDMGPIAFAPHKLKLGVLSEGKHTLNIRLYGNRYNSFGCLHNTNTDLNWFGPTCWRTSGNDWAYQYQLKANGIMQNPRICTSERNSNER